MNIIDIIEKKKNNGELSDEEIGFFITNYTSGVITDYQAAALIMAICINGMTQDEILSLTMHMAHSGDVLDLSEISKNIVDKHSTGGVGDKVTLIVTPIIASLGIPVAKMSGRGLGITGGTADKLESIPGYKIDVSLEQFKKSVLKVGACLASQTMDLAPADKKIYALRDTIGCTNSMPLIASSIMSKKIAAGANSIVLDVTCGSGAFMQDTTRAKELAKLMVLIGKLAGRKTICVITNMDEPLGRTVGNSLEVIESIESLKGNMEKDVKNVVYALCTEMMLLSGKYKDKNECTKAIDSAISSQMAFKKFKELVENQGGDVSYIEDTSKFEVAPIISPVISEKDGFVEELNAYKVGKAGVSLGIGRLVKTDSIDYRVGFKFEKKVGDRVQNGDILAYIYANSPEKAVEAIEAIKDAYKIGNDELHKKDILDIIM